MGHPLHNSHAIDVIAFVVGYEQEFSREVVDSLKALKETMAGSYPVFSTAARMEILVKNNTMTTSSNEVSGIFMQSLADNGKPAWTLRAQNNNIVVTCHGTNYTTWRGVSSKAIADLKTVATIVADNQNPFSFVALQVVDRFIQVEKDSYAIGQVFNPESKYLTKMACEAGKLWHVHQGWFQDVLGEESTNSLNVLKISTNDTPPGILTTIDHNSKISLSPPKQADESANDALLATLFDQLHGNNKEIVTDLLNVSQRETISI